MVHEFQPASPGQHGSSEDILELADQCVKCGLCLPHCPTYGIARNENEGPRGRIALLQGLALGELEATPGLRAHLDRCLACRACEAACPANVSYGRLLDLGRAELRRRGGGTDTVWSRWFRRLAVRPRRLAVLARLARLYQVSGIRRLVRSSHLLEPLGLSRLERLLPALPPRRRLPKLNPAPGHIRGTVGLFVGCMTSAFDRRTLEAAIQVLNAYGYTVSIPATQSCCGALHAHAGDTVTADTLKRRNLAAFPADLEAIVYVASGCGAQLVDYGRQESGDAHEGLASAPVEVMQFLERKEAPRDLGFRPLPARALVHEPCTLRNVARASASAYRVLARIPDLRLEALPGNARCCGAAGSYMLDQPDIADRLREDKLQALRASPADYLLTSNIGCALHLAAGLNGEAEILHPVELLARQLEHP